MDLPIQVISLVADVVIFIFAGYYLLKIRKKEQVLEKKEEKIDTSFHHVVDDALAKERQIVTDAAQEANKILMDAQYIKQNSIKEFEDTLKKMIQDLQQESLTTAATALNSYSTTLQNMTASSLNDFENIIKGLEGDLEKQIHNFKQTVLPNMEKEIEEYKKVRLQQAESQIQSIVQKASQEFFNKSISLEDHHKLLIDALEKAKAEGMFV